MLSPTSMLVLLVVEIFGDPLGHFKAQLFDHMLGQVLVQAATEELDVGHLEI